MSASDHLGGQFLQRRHAQLMEGFNQQTEERLHREVDRYHEAGHHNWTPEHSINLAAHEHATGIPNENDPWDTVPLRSPPASKCTWCRSRGVEEHPDAYKPVYGPRSV